MLAFVICFLLGSLLGTLANEFVDRFGCMQRYHSPLPKKVFIAFASGLAALFLYFWEVQNQMLLPDGLPKELHSITVYRYAVHLLLLTLLLAATLTDFYEMIIPDTITATGTVLAVASVCVPESICPALPVSQLYWSDTSFYPMIVPQTFAMHVWSPNPAETLHPFTMWLLLSPLMILGGIVVFDGVWFLRYLWFSLRKAFPLVRRYVNPAPKHALATALGVVITLLLLNDPNLATRTALLSALTGMAIGMILIWGIRIVARWILGIEAMGFGDVTLMGMIGAFLGWQAVLLVFFLAPFFGLIYGIIHWLLGKGRAVPYGPFLCLATVVVLLAWSPIWSSMAEVYSFGIGIIGIALLVLLVLFGGLLHIVHQIFSRLRG